MMQQARTGPVKVLHLIESLGYGGAEQQLLATVRGLDSGKIVSLVGALFAPLDLRAAFEEAGARVIPLSLRGRFDWGRGVLGLAQVLRSEQIDIVHTHLFHANFYGRLAARLAGSCVVVTTHHSADYTYQDTGRLSFKMRKAIDRLTATRMNAAHLAVSRAVRDDYQRHFGLRDIQLLYNFVDPARYARAREGERDQWRARYGCSDRDVVLLNVGRLHPEKGQRFLVLAMPHILQAIPSATLVLVGTGADAAPLRALAAEHQVEQAIVFAGHQPDVRPYLSMADVFILPSNIEGLPVSLLEAMAMGLPVIATRVGGTSEVITDGMNGVLVPPAQPEAIGQAAVRLCQDADLRGLLGQRARRTVEERFSVTVQVPRLEAFYERLCGRRVHSWAIEGPRACVLTDGALAPSSASGRTREGVAEVAPWSR